MQLARLAEQAPPFLEAGVRVLAVGPDPPEAAAALRERAHIPFPILSDESRRAAREICAGASHCEVLLDRRGVVRWAAYAENWRETPAPEIVLQVGYRLP